MCGIFGYVGESTDVGGAVLTALKTLEYRGYDSWGMAIGVDGQLAVTKTPGKISVASVDFPEAEIGFGHTRWATHGGVTEANAHPHLDCTRSIAVIHNGIIENFRELRDEVAARGHLLRSETDSEVIAHLMEDELASGRLAQGCARTSLRAARRARRGDRARSRFEDHGRDQAHITAGGRTQLHRRHDRIRRDCARGSCN